MNQMDKEALDFILDTFTGSDGGVGFIHLRSFIISLRKQADAGDPNASEVLERTLYTFKRFIELAETHADKKP